MDEQLVLVQDERRDWQLDEETRERGRKGVALARAAVVDASRRTAA